MSMIGAALDRAQMVKAKLLGDGRLERSGWRDVWHEVFKHYGVKKRVFQRTMKVESATGGMKKIGIDGKEIYWPASADPKRLVDMYFEVYTQGNHHYFNVSETRVRPGDIVLDCGACEGYFSLQALELGAGRVVCIEPGRAIGRCLQMTFEKEVKSGRVEIRECLLGDRNGTARFFEDPHDPTRCRILAIGEAGETTGVWDIDMLTIDSLCERNGMMRVDYLKADVEGAEVRLLQGAERLLRRARPKLAIAAYHNADDASQIISYLTALGIGYRLRVKGIVVYGGVPRPVMVHGYLEDPV